MYDTPNMANLLGRQYLGRHRILSFRELGATSERISSFCGAAHIWADSLNFPERWNVNPDDEGSGYAKDFET